MDEAQRGPNKLAADCEALIPKLIAEREAAKDDAKKRALQARIKSARMLLRWCKSRAGYVAG